jgi:prepilin-type N-terminal cleavage/methylation domain-containing protein
LFLARFRGERRERWRAPRVKGRSTHGLTLIELLVVIAIMAILTIQPGGDREDHTWLLDGASADSVKCRNSAFLHHSQIIFRKSRYFLRKNVLQAVTGQYVALVATSSLSVTNRESKVTKGNT